MHAGYLAVLHHGGIRPLVGSSCISLRLWGWLCCVFEHSWGGKVFPPGLKHMGDEAWAFFSSVQARYLNIGLVVLCVFRHPDTSELVVAGRLSYWKSKDICPCESFYSCLKVTFGLWSHKDAFANVVSVCLFLYKSTCLAWTECLNNKQLKDSLIASFWVFPLWSAWDHMASALTLRISFLEAFLRC